MYNFEKAYEKYEELTKVFFKNKDLDDIKKQSQYFTPINESEKLLDDLIIVEKETIKILDPSCGHGILILKLLDKLLKNRRFDKIVIYVYDTDSDVLDNFKIIFDAIEFNDCDVVIDIKYFNFDFLESNINFKFDYIVMNPPYKKMNLGLVPTELKLFLNGQPNAYHLFIAKALSYLDDDGTLCIVSPKNYLSGRYTELLRKYIFDEFSIHKIHTFNNRNTIFKSRITQEICIVHIRKTDHKNVILSYNGNVQLRLPISKLKINNITNIVQTPRDLYDYGLLERFKKFPVGVIGSTIFMKTGKIIQFRVPNKAKVLMSEKFCRYDNGIPLIVYRHINTGIFKYAKLTEKKANTAITVLNEGGNNKLIKNKNYLLVRKNTDKKYTKLIHAVSYLKNLDSKEIAIDNGIAYFTNLGDNLTEGEVLGLQCILMSKQFDDYYRMLNSSHALNIYEFQNMHFPNMDTIRNIGLEVIHKEITVDIATDIFERYL